MPDYMPALWAQVGPGANVLGRDGRPRLILAMFSSNPNTLIIVTTIEGSFPVNPRAPVVMLVPTMQEATLALLTAFPGSEIIHYDH